MNIHTITSPNTNMNATPPVTSAAITIIANTTKIINNNIANIILIPPFA